MKKIIWPNKFCFAIFIPNSRVLSLALLKNSTSCIDFALTFRRAGISFLNSRDSHDHMVGEVIFATGFLSCFFSMVLIGFRSPVRPR